MTEPWITELIVGNYEANPLVGRIPDPWRCFCEKKCCLRGYQSMDLAVWTKGRRQHGGNRA